MTYYDVVDSPVGDLLLTSEGDGLSGLHFSTGSKAREADPGWHRAPQRFSDVKMQLGEYFAGQRKAFDLALTPPGTPFQQSVLNQLQQIPYGETRSYLEVAQAIGNPKAVRAVGAANGANPIAIIIPCHRVIGSNGSLTGFGGGLPAKRLLLELELNQSGLFAS